MALVHGSPETAWHAPTPEASDAELQSVYAPLGQPIAVYGHIHRPLHPECFGDDCRQHRQRQPRYDGERRAAYLLLDNLKPAIRRVDYNLDCELKALSGCGLPHSDPYKRHSPDAITIAPAHGTQVRGCFQVLIS